MCFSAAERKRAFQANTPPQQPRSAELALPFQTRSRLTVQRLTLPSFSRRLTDLHSRARAVNSSGKRGKLSAVLTVVSHHHGDRLRRAYMGESIQATIARVRFYSHPLSGENPAPPVAGLDNGLRRLALGLVRSAGRLGI